MSPPPRPASRPGLSRTVIILGFTSFFTDIGSEMIFPLLPVFLSEVLRASPAFLGLIEGVADTVASLLKLVSGLVSDRVGRRKPLVLLGYGLAGLVRPLVALAAAPWHVLAVRFADRIGKGLRASPRDALIAESVPPSEAGRAFGFQRSMDHAGAVIGPMVAAALLSAGFELRTVFWLAAIPGVCALIAVFAIREERRPDTPAPPTALQPPAEPAKMDALRPGDAATGAAPTALPRRFHGYLGILIVFLLGNSSDAFLLLRAHDVGLPTALVPLLWTIFHVSKVVSSYLAGALSDRIPRVRLIVAGWAVYAAAYLGFGLADAPWQIWLLFPIYGLHHGFTEPVERALVVDLVPPARLGRAFGFYHFTVGVSALPASLLTGWLWSAYGPEFALLTGAALAAIAAILLSLWQASR